MFFKPPAPEPFKQYFPTISSMDSRQLRFYQYWRKKARAGKYVKLDGNISYAYVYIYEVLSSNNPREIIRNLSRLQAACYDEPKIVESCSHSISDSYICLNKFKDALNFYGQIPFDVKSGHKTDRLLSLKLALGEDISGKDALTLFGAKVTKFAKDHLESVAKYIDIALEAERKNNKHHFLKDWVRIARQDPQGYSVYTGTFSQRYIKNISSYSFSHVREIEDYLKDLTREAENSFREERGVPRVGEGWIAETNLFYQIKEAFPKCKVIHHARPAWLGRQHLDIMIENFAIAIEYQGLQHDKPVAFFGGEEAYLENIKRDKRKKRLCDKHGVYLIYVREGYLLNDVINEIHLVSSR